ncbi:uncharacterized protein hydra [Drosophila bipectinata]|uniref:uncharacterized protein hydra n=1 Tax=Drosophila bipectinata TaxID=42026 RepID=UPI001C8A5A31|nr:uncharacterized protein LOC108130087 isoform X1 [Drosophila bipectinata]
MWRRFVGLNKIQITMSVVNPIWTTAMSSWWRRYSTTRMKPQFPYPSPGGMRRHQINRYRGGTNGTAGLDWGAAEMESDSEDDERSSQFRSMPISARPVLKRLPNVNISEDWDSDSEDISAASSRLNIAEGTMPQQQDKLRRKSAWKSWRMASKSNAAMTVSRGQELWMKALSAARGRNPYRVHGDEDDGDDLPEHEPGPYNLMPPLKPVRTLNFFYQQSILNGNGVPAYRSNDTPEDKPLELDSEVDLDKIDSVSALERVRKERERRRAQKKMLDLMQQQSDKDQLAQDLQDHCYSEDQMRIASLGGEPPRRSRSDEEKQMTQLMIAQEPRPDPSQDPQVSSSSQKSNGESGAVQKPSLPPIPDAKAFDMPRETMPREFIPLSPTAAAIKDLDYSRQYNVLQQPPRSGLEQGEPPEVMRSLRRIRSLSRSGRLGYKSSNKEDSEDRARCPPLTEQPPRSRGPFNSVMDIHKARAIEMEKRRIQEAGSKESATSYLSSQIFEKNRR